MLANFLKVHDCLDNVSKLPQLGTIYRPKWTLSGGDQDSDDDDEDDEKVEVEIEVDDEEDDDDDEKDASNAALNGSTDPKTGKIEKSKKKKKKVKVPKQFEVKCSECGLPNVSDYEWECECDYNFDHDIEPQNKYPPTKKTLKAIEQKLEDVTGSLGSRTAFAMKRVITTGNSVDSNTSSTDGNIPSIQNILDFVHVNGAPLPKDPDTLWALGKQSAYGDLKTMKTTFDTNVRNAREISLPHQSGATDASSVSSSSNTFGASSSSSASGDAIKSIELTEQAKKLLDESVRDISEMMFGGIELGYQINKINLYGPGGHFKEHIDTPRDGVVGSLVVRLPYHYDGGRFSIRFSTSETDGTALARVAEEHSTYKKSISLLAFYCECPHKIDRVTAGLRVTITFYLTQRSAAANSSTSSTTTSVASSSSSSSPVEISSTSQPQSGLTSGVVESKEEKVASYEANSSTASSTLTISTEDADKSLQEWEEVDSELVKEAVAASPAEATNGSESENASDNYRNSASSTTSHNSSNSHSSDSDKVSLKRKNPFAETDDAAVETDCSATIATDASNSALKEGKGDPILMPTSDDDEDDDSNSSGHRQKKAKNNRSNAGADDSTGWQYFLHRSNSVDNLRNEDPDEVLKLVTEYFACLKSLGEPSRPIGIFLNHPYSAEQFLAKTFKGADVNFMRKILETSGKSDGKFVAVNIPVVIDHEESACKYDRSDSTKSISVHSLLDIDLQQVARSDESARTSSRRKSSTDRGNRGNRVAAYSNILFFGKKWKQVSRQYDPGAEHAGNESRDSSLMATYFANAVIFVEKSDTNADSLADFIAFAEKQPRAELVLDC